MFYLKKHYEAQDHCYAQQNLTLIGPKLIINMENKEIEIEAPWGKIAAKAWGHPDNQLVIAVHGIMDNAGTFNKLIPLLPDFFYVCVDLPGHGRSSHFPPHLPIFSINFVMIFHIVLKHFQREKCIIMGHSYGGQQGQLFAQLYPERVEKLIMFDTIHFFTVPPDYFKDLVVDKINQLLKFEEKLKQRSAPAYTYQQALERIIKGRPVPLPVEAAEILAERSLIPVSNNKFQLSLDQRLKFVFNPLHTSEYVVQSLRASPITCPVLIIFGSENTVQRHLLKSILNYFKSQKNFKIKYLPGHHDIHLTDAKSVAPLVKEFLLHSKSKL